MTNKDWVICDLTGIILNDGVTLIPGYITIEDGIKYTYTSDDPMNELAKIRPWILHNRLAHQIVTAIPCDNKKLQGKSFISEEAIKDYLTIKKR